MGLDTSKIGNEKLAYQANRVEKLFEQVADYSKRIAALEAIVFANASKPEAKKAADKTAVISKDEVSE